MGDKLTEAEREFIRTRAAKRCMDESEKFYVDTIKKMNDSMLGFKRNQRWKYEYFEKKGSKDRELESTTHLHVWKVDPPHVYFRLVVKEVGTTYNKYIKLDTTMNEEILRNLQKQKCDKDITISGSSTLVVNDKTNRISSGTDEKSDTEYDYRFVTDLPAYFGMLNYKKTVRYYKKDDVIIDDKTNIHEFIISSPDTETQHDDYTHSDYINRQYCVVKHTPATPLNSYKVPIGLDCVENPSTTRPDANGDGIADFVPATELVDVD